MPQKTKSAHPSTGSNAQSSVGWRLIAPLLIMVGTYVLYWPALGYGWTDTDDIQLIVEDAQFLTSGTALPDAFQRALFPRSGAMKQYYRPLVTLTFMADARRATPLAPRTFHETNNLLHALSAGLLFAIAQRLITRRALAVIAALLFAAHPAAVQTVAWVPGRSDGLMVVFALISLYAWIEFEGSSTVPGHLSSAAARLLREQGGARRRRWALGVHWASLFAALLSKETAVAVIPIALTYSLFVTRRYGQLKWGPVLAGWFVSSAAWLALRTHELGGFGTSSDFGGWSRSLLTVPVAFGKLLLPIDLQVLATLRDSSIWPALLAIALLGVAVIVLREVPRRLFIWAALLVPALSLVPTMAVSEQLILDNRLYLPLAGFAVGIMACVNHALTQRPRTEPVWRMVGVVGGLVLVVLTLRYEGAFESPRAFCEAAVAGSPHLALAHVNLGSTEYREGNLNAAERQFREAVAIDARWPVAHNNLGLIYMNQGQLVQAEAEFRTELSINPEYPKAHYNLGLVLARTGREQEASQHFERVVEIVPSDIGAWGELLKYWGPRDAGRAGDIMRRMEQLGVVFHSPG
jgi:protein O-mannosyl-transferase